MLSATLSPGTIVLINGASSAGKTSLLRALQRTLSDPFLDAGLDRFLWMLPGRYLERPLWDDVLGRATQAGAIGRTLVSGMHHAIAALARAGNHLLVDHVLVEPEWVRECAALFSPLPAYCIGLHCPLDVLEARERARRDRTLGQARAQFERVHAHTVYDFSLNSAELTPDEAALHLQAWLAGRPTPQALRRLAT